MDPTPARRQVHGFEVEAHDSVSSTQELLKRRLAAGEVVAGKGRRGTPWTSPLGGSYQSLALRAVDLVSLAGARASDRSAYVDGRLTLALGLGIARSLNGAGGHVLLKWPNDLILDDQKLGGIIVEIVAGTVIAGIGINVENEVPNGAAALRGWDIETVSDLVLKGVRDGLDLLRQPPESFVLRYSDLDWLRGRQVEVRGGVLQQGAAIAGESPTGNAVASAVATAVGSAAGTADGIEADGSLRVRRQDGSTIRNVNGHVNLIGQRPQQS